MIVDPLFYLLAIPALIGVGISKGGFGAALGSLAVPLMSLAVPVPQAAGIALPILCVMDLIGVVAYRRQWDPANMRIMIPGALIGIAIGTLTFRYLDEALIRLLIGAIAVGFALNHWFVHSAAGAAAPRSLGKGTLWSGVSGFTSFVAHAGGPPLAVYLLPQRLDKTLYVGTTVIYFTVVNYVKLVPYAWLGQLSTGNLWTSLVLLPMAPLGMWLGFWLHDRIRTELFYRWTYRFLFLSGLKLVYDGLRAWI